jgi:hypothetical protein
MYVEQFLIDSRRHVILLLILFFHVAAALNVAFTDPLLSRMNALKKGGATSSRSHLIACQISSVSSHTYGLLTFFIFFYIFFLAE